MAFGFNARYLLECAHLIAEDDIEFVLSEPSVPALIRAPKDDASLFVVMPVRF